MSSTGSLRRTVNVPHVALADRYQQLVGYKEVVTMVKSV